MKRLHLTFIILFIAYCQIYAQGQYGSTYPSQTIYPYETATFFRTRQDLDVMFRPFNMSSNGYIPAAAPVGVLPEGTYLFKKRKKQAKVRFPKGSHIIPL